MGLSSSQSSVDREPIQTSPMSSSIKMTNSKSSISLSSSSDSLSSQSVVCRTRSDSSQSTLISRRFISYDNENAIISIGRNNNSDRNQSWSFRLVSKYTHTSPENAFVVFGMCNKALLDSGHKHKWYGCGYSVTYCQGYKLTSYVASFKVGSIITIRYKKEKRQITIWCDGRKEKRCINVEHHPLHEYVVTIKSYNQDYAIQMMQ